MRFRLKNKSYVLNTKIKLVGKNGANLSIITSDINNPTSNYNLITNTITFCLSPLPAVIGDPEVVVNQYTTAALDFENGLIDKIPTTVWTKEGTADITSVNKIFGQNSFETKALGDSLYTNSNVITGGSTPFTIEFYSLIKGRSQASGSAIPELYYPLYAKNNNVAYGEQVFSLTNLMFPRFERRLLSNPIYYTFLGTKVRFNEIDKHLISYDGAAVRWFLNDKLQGIVGTSLGLNTSTSLPFTFFRNLQPSYSNLETNTHGLLDNINIHDGIATKVRDPDPYEEFLVVDLAFDGENNSTKIIDNGSLKSTWITSPNAKISTDQKFDGFSSLYCSYSGGITTASGVNIGLDDFSIEFEFFITSFNTYNYIASQNGNGRFHFSISGTNLSMGWNSGGGFSVPYSYLINTRYKILITRNYGNCSGYVNNTLVSNSNSLEDKDINFSGSSFMIGNCEWDSSANILGYIKNFKIYKDVAIIPESPVGKIQLDFDNNLTDKYNNSTWTNNGVTFDQVNSVKGHAAYFNGSQSNKLFTANEINFNVNDFKFSMDIMITSFYYSAVLFSAKGYLTLYYDQGSKCFSMSTGINQNNDYTQNTVFNRPIKINTNIYYNISIIFKNDKAILLINNELHQIISNLREVPAASTIYYIGSGVDSNTSICGYIDNFKSQVGVNQGEVIIDKPAVHLPLETNATNIGFTPLTINNVGNPTYTTVDGKKCIKFESGKYLTINSNNIFNLGTSSDFYIELDINIQTAHTAGYGHSILANGTSNPSLGGMWLQVYPNNSSYGNVANKVSLDIATQSKIHSTNNFNFGQWNNVILKRKNNKVSIILNDIETTLELNLNLDFTIQNLTTVGFINGANPQATLDGYMSNFKMFVGTSEIPETYNDKAVLDLDFKPTRKSYLFKDNNNKCVIHPVNITQRDYQGSQYCCTFNGTDQYLQLGKNDLFNFGLDDFIINFKIKPKFSLNSTHNFSRIFAPGMDTVSSLKEYIMLPGENYPLPAYRGTVMVVLDEPTVVFMVTPRLSEAEVNNVTLVRSGNLFSLYLNEIVVEEKTFTGDFNLNRYDETIIGASKSSSEVVSYLNATLYSIKILRNTSDLSLL